MKAADQNHAKSQVMLGNLHYQGQCIVENYPKAIILLKKSAMAGDSIAQYNLGILYYDGEQIPKNPNKAVFWLKMAARQNSLSAQTVMGEAYENGFGVTKNLIYAYALYHRAAPRYAPAAKLLNDLERRMSLEEIARAKSTDIAKLFEK